MIAVTNLAIDTNLLEGAYKIGGLESERATVDLALKEFIERRKTTKILELFGTVEYDKDYDYKEARRRNQ